MGMGEVSDKTKEFGPVVPGDYDLTCIEAKRHDWTRKNGDAKKTLGMVLTFELATKGVEMREPDTIPGRISDYINLEKHPCTIRGEDSLMATSRAFQLETMLGFEPYYVNDAGSRMEMGVTRTGKPKPPKGSHRRFNPDFIEAYFTKGEDGQEEPKFGVWESAKFRANLDIQESEEFGPKNVIKKYLRPE